MCPPVSVRYGKEGVSYLYQSWLYQILYGDEMRLCFSCFKAAYLVQRERLEMEDWEEGDWDPESMELPQAGPEKMGWPELVPSLWQEHWQPEQWGPGLPTLSPGQTDGMALATYPLPTELEPYDVVPLDLGPEDADPMQALPWNYEGLSSCPHWNLPSLYWLDLFHAVPPGSLPIVLELNPTLPVDIVEAETWLMDLKFVCVLDSFGSKCYITPLCSSWVVRNMVQRWEMLIRPVYGEVILAKLQEPIEDLHRWRLSVLETTELGVELVTLDSALQKGGFSVHAYSPWRTGTPEVWRSGPQGPGESQLVLNVTSQKGSSSSNSPPPEYN